jgi:ElaB/YqjD/DUF883 family membrane-anchored ribosome-binding protein
MMSSNTAGGSRSDEIVGDIDETRSEMTDTVDAIEQRLAPERLAKEARRAARDATIGRVEAMTNDANAAVADAGDTIQRTGFGVAATIRQNPIPAALTAIGVGWLFMNRDTGRADFGGGSYASNGGGRVVDQARRAQERVRTSVDRGSESVERTADQLETKVRTSTRSTGDQLRQLWDDNPLGMAALGVAAGMAAGMLVPSTEQERRTIGPVRDRTIDAAETAAEKTFDRAREEGLRGARHGALESARQTAEQTANQAKQTFDQQTN